MASAAPSTPLTLTPGEALVAHRRKELAYARALGIGVGIFLLLWSPFSLARWQGVSPFWAHFEEWFFIFYGLLLLLPYGRVRAPKAWRRLFTVLAAVSLMFVFVLVFDVLYVAKLLVENKTPGNDAPDGKALYVYAEDSGTATKLPFPALNCALVFLGLLQVPVVLFSRHPDWMD